MPRTIVWITGRPALLASLTATFLLLGCGGGGGGGGSDVAGGMSGGTVQIHVGASSIRSGAEGVDPKTTLQLTFDAPPAPDGLSDNVTLDANGVRSPASVSVNGSVLSVTPTSALRPRTVYTLTVKAGTRSTNGTSLASDYKLNFKTRLASFEYVNLVPVDRKFLYIGPPRVAVADLDGDGRPDVVQLTGMPSAMSTGFNPGYALSLYSQNSTGGLDKVQEIDFEISSSSVQVRSYSRVILLDIDGDGRPEILVPEYAYGNQVDSGLRIFKRQTDGKFAVSGFIASLNVGTFETVDVDGDGRKDLVGIGADNYGSSLQVFWNTGAGLVPSPAVSLPPLAPPTQGQYQIGVTDFDHDGVPELIVGREGKGMTAFNRVGQYGISQKFDMSLPDGGCNNPTDCATMAFVDVNGDGWADLVFGNGAVYRRTPNGGYSLELTHAFNVGSALLSATDMDADGVVDLAIIGLAYLQGQLNWTIAVAFPNRATQTFEYSDVFPLPVGDSFVSGGVAVADFDGNGLPDLLVALPNYGIGIIRQIGG